MKNKIFFIIPFCIISFWLTSCNDQNSANTTESSSNVTEELEGEETQKTTPPNDKEETNKIPSPDKFDYKEYHENGSVKILGNYNDENQRQGVWYSYYESGQKWSESNYNKGMQHGHSVTFFPNGNVRYVGDYEKGEKVGKWIFYDEKGSLIKEETY